MRSFPFTKQFDVMDCGPACLKMIAQSYGKTFSLEYLRNSSYITKEGVSLLGISDAAEHIGLRSLVIKVPLQKLVDHAPFPCVIHWNQRHFVVLYKVKNNTFFIADPGHGLRKIPKEDFIKCWQGTDSEGIALLLEPTESFYTKDSDAPVERGGFGFLFNYLGRYKFSLVQLVICMLAGSGISLILPFLTQSMVDNGINAHNLKFIQLILISQIILFVGSTAIDTLRAWLVIHLNGRVNITIISDFLMKLMRLPISYFDSKLVGDIKQRIYDNNRVQTFLTENILTTLFSIINLIVLSVVMAIYNMKIFLVFVFFSVLSAVWIVLFLRRRKQLDYKRFQTMGENENVLVELITGMQEIKLNNSERIKRWGWERVQAKLFKLNMKGLVLGQYQQMGYSFFSQLKNILISYIVARAVVEGEMTFGMMMSVSYIIGQMNAPVQAFPAFVQSAQDAKISLDRLREILGKKDEEDLQDSVARTVNETIMNEDVSLPQRAYADENTDPAASQPGIRLKEVSFQYAGPKSPFVLKNISVHIPKGKVTAIVGTSGSGKTTLMKLLLNSYKPVNGKITVNNISLNEISPSHWRSKCGIVMQDGYIFSDSIANNIAMNDEHVDHRKLRDAVALSNIQDFIEELPLTYNTKVGNSGIGISVGQKQRLLIARAVYKNPDYLFFDEATSSLDANNERRIMENLQSFYDGRTVIVVAHRLSTVRHAHQIIVLENGEIAEIGTHELLVNKRGKYFELVKNQLELGA